MAMCFTWEGKCNDLKKKDCRFLLVAILFSFSISLLSL